MDYARQWYEKPPGDRTAHDWLYAAAKELLDRGDEDHAFAVAARLVMDFADEHVQDLRVGPEPHTDAARLGRARDLADQLLRWLEYSIHDHYDGTSSLQERLAEVARLRAILDSTAQDSPTAADAPVQAPRAPTV